MHKLLLVCLFCCFACTLASAREFRGTLAVPVAPMAYLLQQVAGDDYAVETLIPAGASPHTFEVKPRQMASLSQALVYFSLGMPLEQQVLAKLRAMAPAMQVVDLNQGIALRYPTHDEEGFAESGHDHSHGQGAAGQADAHTWLSPPNALQQARTMAQTLALLSPDRAPYYADNMGRLAEKLKSLDSAIAKELAPFKGQRFLVYHPAFGYLADRYGLIQVAVEMGGQEPTPRRLARLVAQARQYGVKIIFTQPQFPQAAAARLAQELNAKVVALDPLAYDYVVNLEKIAAALQTGL